MQARERKEFEETCNFTFRVVGTVRSSTSFPGASDPEMGWVLSVSPRNGKDVLVSMRASRCTSKTSISRAFYETVPGAICQLSLPDFLRFVKEDSASFSSDSTFFSVRESGFHTEYGVWAFDGLNFDATGTVVSPPTLLLSREGGIRVPPPLVDVSLSASRRALCDAVRLVSLCYGEARMHAIHVMSVVWKAIHRSEILAQEKQISVCNVSGPPDVGKSLIGAVSASLLGCSSLMASRSTQSAMLDMAHCAKNLLVVWDDPRDVSRSLAESIVHEAFHGLPSSTIRHGQRQYNSCLLVGTQRGNFGFPDLDPATCSRISHVEMQQRGEPLNREAEEALKSFLPSASRSFLSLLRCGYEAKEVEAEFVSLSSSDPKLIGRCLKNLALDIHAMRRIDSLTGGGVGEGEIRKYVQEWQLPFLRANCTVQTKWEKFKEDLASLHSASPIPATCLKKKVAVAGSKGRTDCAALYLPSLLPLLSEAGLPSYTPVFVQEGARETGGGGVLISQNVKFPDKVKRSLVVPRWMMPASLLS